MLFFAAIFIQLGQTIKLFFITNIRFGGNTTSEDKSCILVKHFISTAKDYGFELSSNDIEVECISGELYDKFGLYTFDIGRPHMYYRMPNLKHKINWEQIKIHSGKVESILKSTRYQTDLTDYLVSLRKDITSLPVNIYIDEAGLYKKLGISKRIFFQTNKETKFCLTTLCPMRLDGTVPKRYLESLFSSDRNEFTQEDLSPISTFVKNNADALSKIADQQMDICEFEKLLMQTL